MCIYIYIYIYVESCCGVRPTNQSVFDSFQTGSRQTGLSQKCRNIP